MAGSPQAVSRRGKPAVVVLSAADYEALLRAARGRFADHLLDFPSDDTPPLPRAKARPRDAAL